MIQNGVWLSLARAPGLGPGGRRFESCHPDFLCKICGCSSMVEHQPSKLDTWVRFPSPALTAVQSSDKTAAGIGSLETELADDQPVCVRSSAG